MNTADNDKFNAISKALSAQLIYHALTLMESLTGYMEAGILSDRLQSLATNYRYLTDYFISGADDPKRTPLLRQLTAEAYRLFDDIKTLYKEQHLSHTETELRLYAEHTHEGHIGSLKDIFYHFLLSNDPQELRQKYNDLTMAKYTQEQCMAVSALTLNTLNRFSEANILLLCDIVTTADIQPAQRACTGLILILHQYDERLPFFPALMKRLSELAQDPLLQKDILYICQCMLETSQTKQVEQVLLTMQQDILSRPTQQTETTTPKHIIINLEDLEDGNPEWGTTLNANISKHISKMMELHRNGADFNYTSTKEMLSDAFFQHDITHWFLPFDKQYTALGIDFETQSGKIISKLLSANIDACDIDKYAICIASKRMQNTLTEQSLPKEIREMSESDIQDATGSTLSSDPHKTAQTYIRCLYRFFRHNPWKYAEQLPPFTTICQTKTLHILLTETNDWLQLGDLCLNLQLYEAAQHIFQQKAPDTSLQIYQRLGYALQKQGKYTEALEAFRKILQWQDDDVWTLQHAAICLHRLGQRNEAIQLYNTLLISHPDKKSYLQAKAQCLIESGLHTEALQLLYKLDFLFPDDINTWRGLAWCAFACNKTEVAQQYFEQIAQDNNADANDLLNYAHLLFLQHHRKDALRYYTASFEKIGNRRTFFTLLRKDKPLLREKGITEEEMRLLEDILMEHFRNTRR